jgi:hypothetical protein
MRAFRALTCLTMTFVAMGAISLGCVAPAFAQSPWWHLASSSRPTYLPPAGSGSGQSEVQTITVNATAKENPAEPNNVVVIEPTSLLEVEEGKREELDKAEFPFNATHEEAQVALEAVYGTGNVQVTGGPVGKPTTVNAEPYLVTFTGVLADRPVLLIETGFSVPFGELNGEATTGEATHGRAPGELVFTASNLGDAETSATETLTGTLPAGLEAASIEAFVARGHEAGHPQPVCAFSAHTFTCSVAAGVKPYEQVEVRVGVAVGNEAASGELVEMSVSGGGAPAAQITRPVTVSAAPVPFGVQDYELTPELEGGLPDTQAGSHPFQTTFTLTLNQDATPLPVALPKDLTFKLPAGLIGDPTPFPRCTAAQFHSAGGGTCSPQTVLGEAIITINEPGLAGMLTTTTPVFNLEPTVGEPARFGFLVQNVPVIIDTSVRTGEDYGITGEVRNIPQIQGFLSASVSFWGVPGQSSHDLARGAPVAESDPPPFFELPTSCTGPLLSTVEGDSWTGQSFEPVQATEVPALDGCNRLPFSPELTMTPDGQAASTPTGLTVDVHVPQEASLNANGIGEADPKDITVTLPQGLQLNPAAADGLQACSEAQIGYRGENPQTHLLEFTPAEPSCPDSSKIANATITTPLLPADQPLKGAVYLAAPQNFAGPPQENPFSALVAMYIVVRDPTSGVLVKLPGSVSLDQATGQITTTFANSPQAPFEDAKLEFFGGARAPLATPARCGSYTAIASFSPWSGNEPIGSSSSFDITSGPNGGACPGASLPFAASLAAGTTNINAGGFTPLTTTISREDGNQDIQQVTLHMPPGLSGVLAGVPLCPEAQANAGTCGEESRIGETIVSVGLGGDPFTVTGGKVYLTEKYEGAPFGLSIVNPADAGPFHLGNVVVRAKIDVDPSTAQLTITTGQIPHIIKGFPLQIKHVNVNINRPGFTFNPTSCDPMSITGAIGSWEGASSPVSTQFQVTNCAALKFAPKFTVSTSGKTSKANGASLTVKLTYPSAPFGSQANIRSVKVELPKQLPSRLTTLQKACTNAQFQANPAGCPPASFIGHAKAITPLLPVPLEGPAIFVSHGGEAFPSLMIVLQGYGVTLDLVGTTFINKAGITSSTFKTVPDAPVGSFELSLPEGKFSALAANGNLCTAALAMPTEFVAQNGALISQNTPVSVTGCAKHKALTRAQKLAAALKACHKKANKAKRHTCERAAHKRYGPVKAKKKGKRK